MFAAATKRYNLLTHKINKSFFTKPLNNYGALCKFYYIVVLIFDLIQLQLVYENQYNKNFCGRIYLPTLLLLLFNTDEKEETAYKFDTVMVYELFGNYF